MLSPPRGGRPDGPWSFERRVAPDLDWYLGLYREVGEKWLWYSRLLLPREETAAILARAHVHVYALLRDGQDVGLAEINFADPRDVEINFFGVVAAEIGTGAGKWLMAAVLEAAWAAKPDRVWLHTCTLDHPNALPFYLSQGFRAFKRTVGIYSDPRLLNVVGADVAPLPPVIPSEAGDKAS